MIKPDAVSHMSSIIQAIYDAGFVIGCALRDAPVHKPLPRTELCTCLLTG